MDKTFTADLQASIDELTEQLKDAPEEMRSLVQSQIEELKKAKASLERLQPAIEANKQYRPSLSLEMRRFFTPEPLAALPSWISDNTRRDQVTAPMLRCPPQTKIFEDEDHIGCVIPQGVGQIPIRHGLQLSFYKSSGALQSQRFYEDGLLRWSIEYHPIGTRASEGFYLDTERFQYQPDGLHTHYAPNGTIISQRHWANGKEQGWSKLWEDDGFPIKATRYQQGQVVEEVLPEGTAPQRVPPEKD